MKTSIILIVLLFLNTSVLIAEPIATLLSGVNTWSLLGLEALLFIGYYINTCIRDVNKKCALSTRNLRVFITKSKSA